MPTFRVRVRTQIVNGAQHRHVSVSARRGDYWAVCGILILLPAEWDVFYRRCVASQIEVANDDAPRQSVPADAATAVG
jgi:hypothetical protein